MSEQCKATYNIYHTFITKPIEITLIKQPSLKITEKLLLLTKQGSMIPPVIVCADKLLFEINWSIFIVIPSPSEKEKILAMQLFIN